MESGTKGRDPGDWKKGSEWSRYFSALCRHLFKWWMGEETDPDTGNHHLTAVICCALILLWYHDNGVGTDDREKE
jgi:hypothetical protein